MSNLSLSFSFYFWWTNSSQSVTLSNSLNQTVYCYPRVADGDLFNADVWYENYVNTAWGSLLGGAYHGGDGNDGTEGYRQAPTIVHNANYVEMKQDYNSSNENACGIVYFQNTIDFTNINHLCVAIKSASINNNIAMYQWVGMRWTTSITEHYPLSKEASIVAQGGQTGTKSISETIKTIDLSALTGQKYLAFYLRNIGNLKVEAIWHD